MPTNFASGPSGIVAMAAAVTDYCSSHDLVADIDRQAVARRVIGIFSTGTREKAAILAALGHQDGV